MLRISRFLISLSIAIVIANGLLAEIKTTGYIDKVTERAMKAFNVPGIAVAVVQDGQIVHMKGYGVASIETKAPVDENTLFAIASNSKAFTAAALSTLVKEGKIRWDTPVCDVIPEFRLSDPYVTRAFTISDLLSHRGGLGLGAGDLMIWPDGSGFTSADVIYNLRFLKASSPFRTKYQYNNLMYIVAGEVIARVSGKSWEEYIEERIMMPIGMSHSAACFDRLTDKNNMADSHVLVNGVLDVVEMKLSPMANAAGGIYSSVADMAKWVSTQMGTLKYKDTWEPQVIIPVKGSTPYTTHFSTYALGWRVSDVEGYKMITHTGGLAGALTQVTMIPELGLGIIVLTNQQTSEAFNSVTNTILDNYLGISGKDRVAENKAKFENALKEAKEITSEVDLVVKHAVNKVDKEYLKSFCGTYSDLWLGNVKIELIGDKLKFTSSKSPKLSGEMEFYKGNSFIVKWNERSFDADAFVIFSLNSEGIPDGFKMRAISPLTDFSYDFQDLEFRLLLNLKAK